MDAPPVSVIVPARNAHRFLAAQLAALTRQDPDVVGEIIVVDDGSTDATGRLVSRAAAGDDRIRLVDVAGGPHGAAHARNVGAAHAHGGLLAFCDADDVVADDWALALYSCARRTPAQFIAGRTDHDTLTPPGLRRWPAAIHAGPSGCGGGEPTFAEGCNLAVTPAAFAAVGGFDEALDAAAEDVDFSWRLHDAGYPLTYCADAVVFYRDRQSVAAALRQAYRYGRGNQALLTKTGRPAPTRPQALARAAAAARHALIAGRAERVTRLRQAAFWAGYLASSFGRRRTAGRPGGRC